MTGIATISAIKLALAAVVSVAVVVEDIRRRRISNTSCLLLLALAVTSGAASRGWSGLADGVLGAALGFAVFLIPYGMGGLGGGDVKLMAAFGALTGIQGILPALVLVSIAGAVTSVLCLLWKHVRGQAAPDAIPYAPAIAAGSLLVAMSQIGGR